MPRTLALLFVLLSGCTATRWSMVNGESRALRESGRRGLRLAPIGGNRPGSNVAMALVDGAAFATGTIDVDLEGNGGGQASFLGVAFAVADAEHYEAVYFRPFNFRAADAGHRGHAVQYVAWPEQTWEKLRTATPGVYEAALEPAPDPARWFHARIEIDAHKVRVFVDGARQPCLAVDRLGSPAGGRVGLWVDSQPGAFANLKIVRRLRI
jgi:hypothetical protein